MEKCTQFSVVVVVVVPRVVIAQIAFEYESWEGEKCVVESFNCEKLLENAT